MDYSFLNNIQKKVFLISLKKTQFNGSGGKKKNKLFFGQIFFLESYGGEKIQTKFGGRGQKNLGIFCGYIFFLGQKKPKAFFLEGQRAGGPQPPFFPKIFTFFGSFFKSKTYLFCFFLNFHGQENRGFLLFKNLFISKTPPLQIFFSLFFFKEIFF